MVSACISHGHYDHGGGLNAFLLENSKAKVYIRESAFEQHSSIREYGLKDIGINCEHKDRLVLCNEREPIHRGITLFSNPGQHILTCGRASILPGSALLHDALHR